MHRNLSRALAALKVGVLGLAVSAVATPSFAASETSTPRHGGAVLTDAADRKRKHQEHG